MTIGVIVANLAGLQAWRWSEVSSQDAKRKAIAAVLTTTFPEVQLVVDAPAQMARSLAQLQRVSGAPSGSDIEAVLNHFGTLTTSQTVPTAIEFIAGETRLVGLDANDQGLADVPRQLQVKGYTSHWKGNTLVITTAATGAGL